MTADTRDEGARGCVLVVDDEEINRLILENRFTGIYEVDHASGGREALDRIAARPDGYIAVLLDVMMPVVDGIEVLRRLQPTGFMDRVPVFLITAEREGGSFKNIELTPMQQGKVYNVPAECWFYSITQKDTKVIYVQDSNCSMENSDLADLTAAQIADIQERARKILAE